MRHIKYTGPAQPIPTQQPHRVVFAYFTNTERIARVVLLTFLIGVLLYDMLIGRPG